MDVGFKASTFSVKFYFSLVPIELKLFKYTKRKLNIASELQFSGKYTNTQYR